MKIAVILAFLLVPVLAAAADGPWKVETSTMGSTVTNGKDVAFKAKDAQAAQEMANVLNKVEKKQDKKEKREDKKK